MFFVSDVELRMEPSDTYIEVTSCERRREFGVSSLLSLMMWPSCQCLKELLEGVVKLAATGWSEDWAGRLRQDRQASRARTHFTSFLLWRDDEITVETRSIVIANARDTLNWYNVLKAIGADELSLMPFSRRGVANPLL